MTYNVFGGTLNLAHLQLQNINLAEYDENTLEL